MNLDQLIAPFQTFFVEYPIALHSLKIIGVLALAWVHLLISKRVILKGLVAAAKKTKTDVDDILLRSEIFHRLVWVLPAIIISAFGDLFGGFEEMVTRTMTAVIVLVIILSVSAFLSAMQEFLSSRQHKRSTQFKSYLQITRIVIFLLGGVIIVATLVGKSPLVLLSGIGALTAVLLLIFRDTILSFIASLQISSYDLVKVGDWIEMPQFGADGTVIDIALHTVKVQNWDKTIIVIPTHKLIEGSFKNWRGMEEAGGRRIKRSLPIDQATVRFCDDEMLDRFEKMSLIAEYIRERRADIRDYNATHNISSDDVASGRSLTNFGIFRKWIEAYLHNHPLVHQDLTFLIRQREPTPVGIPLEIYVFTTDTEWAIYEGIQSDIFDHILAAMPLFDLKVYQRTAHA